MGFVGHNIPAESYLIILNVSKIFLQIGHDLTKHQTLAGFTFVKPPNISKYENPNLLQLIHKKQLHVLLF